MSHGAPNGDLKATQKWSKSRLEIKIGQQFDPSKPSRLKDTGVLSWGIISKTVSFSNEKYGSKLAKSLTPVNPLD